MKKVLFVCGTFDENGGKRSSIGDQLHIGFTAKALCPELEEFDVTLYNGGTMATLEHAAHKAASAHAVIWLANVPADHPKKFVRSIKVINPTCVLVTSKRSVEKGYSIPAVVQHALGLHSNLIILFTALANEARGKYRAQLLDPLGNLFWQGTNTKEFQELGATLNLRVSYLLSLQRMGTIKAMGSCPEKNPEENDFLSFVRSSAATFAELIPSPDEITRFVGNASFRCAHGFPAFKDNRAIFVSRRNVDKQGIRMADFVPIIGEHEGKLLYCGDHKPSVDAPVQCRLFHLYPNIRYMIHGHVYLGGAPTTSAVLPCGALLEANEVWEHFPEDDQEAFAINLRGHGFIAGADDVDTLRQIVTGLVARPMLESQLKWVHDQLKPAVQPAPELFLPA